MTDTVSIICTEGKPLSVDAEKKQHSDWVKQEAQLLMDELFLDLEDSLSTPFADETSDPVDVDWIDGLAKRPSHTISQTWASLDTEQPDEQEYWIAKTESTPFYQRLLLILGGLAIVTPLSWWGTTTLKQAASPRSVVAATPMPTPTQDRDSDHAFAEYAEQALRQIQTQPKEAQHSPALGITALPTLNIGDRTTAIPPNLPPISSPALGSNPVAVAPPADKPATSAPSSASVATPQSEASPAEMDRLALRVFKPNQAVKSEVPPVSVDTTRPQTALSSDSTLPAPPVTSSMTAAPSSELPTLAANVAAPSNIMAAATPMSSPAQASKKVIGIVELGLQSTLMVSNNGSHLNFQVGDVVNNEGWKLVQIAQGKAILQKGTEYKTLSEGQYF